MKLLDMICMLEWVKSRMNLIFQSIQKTTSYHHGLRPKLYSFDYEREAHFDCGEEVDKPTDNSVTRIVVDNKVTAKGVKTSVAKK